MKNDEMTIDGVLLIAGKIIGFAFASTIMCVGFFAIVFYWMFPNMMGSMPWFEIVGVVFVLSSVIVAAKIK